MKVEVVEHLGNELMVYGMFGDQPLVARMDARSSIRPGDEVELSFEMERAHLFDPADEHAIISRPLEPSLGLIVETGEVAPSGEGTAAEAEQAQAIEETRTAIDIPSTQRDT